jgi:hypothetical protein
MEAHRALPLVEEVCMRKKLIALSFALAATAAAFPVRSAEAAKTCNGFLSCCDGICHCCSRPCPPAC